MLDKQHRERTEDATVEVGNGNGILLAGGIVLCTRHSVPGPWPYSEPGKEPEIVGYTCYGEPLDLAIRAYADKRHDLAWLVPAHGQRGEGARAFVARTEGVRLRTRPVQQNERVDVWLHLRGKWAGGQVTHRASDIDDVLRMLGEPVVHEINAKCLRPGWSGSPVADSNGELLGIVTRGNPEVGTGDLVFAASALPGWVMRRVAPKAEATVRPEWDDDWDEV